MKKCVCGGEEVEGTEVNGVSHLCPIRLPVAPKVAGQGPPSPGVKWPERTRLWGHKQQVPQREGRRFGEGGEGGCEGAQSGTGSFSSIIWIQSEGQTGLDLSPNHPDVMTLNKTHLPLCFFFSTY